MREIKFRGQSVYLDAQTGDSKWIYGDLLQGPDYIRKHKIIGTYGQIEVLACTVGQFTGLYDCDGIEIYEGDVIDFIRDGELCDTRCYVRWHPYLSKFDLCFSYEDQPKKDDTRSSLGEMMQKYKVKILGNIHDNPDLIARLSPYIICK